MGGIAPRTSWADTLDTRTILGLEERKMAPRDDRRMEPSVLGDRELEETCA